MPFFASNNAARIGRGIKIRADAAFKSARRNQRSTNHLRSISTTSTLCDGEVAERCNANVISSPHPPITPESWDKPLPDFLMSTWKKQGAGESGTSDDNSNLLSDELAIFDGSTGMKRSFSDYYKDTRGIAGSLRYDLGVDENSCVCLFAPNHVDYLPVTLAVGLIGAKITPVNPLYKSNELQTVLDKSRSSILIAHKSNLEVALEAAKDAKSVKHILVMTEDGEAAADGQESLESIKQHSQGFDKTSDCYDCASVTHPYLLPYSSGTTGLPKGVCLTHSNITANLLQMDVIEGPHMRSEDALFSPLPFFHIYGMVASMMYCGWKGSPILTMSGRFDFELMLDMIQKYQPTNAHLVPPIILTLAKSPQVDEYDLSSLRTIMSAASPLGSDTESAVQNRIGCRVKQAWGMSELSPIGTMSSSTPSDIDIQVGSVGPLVSNTFGKVLDGDGKSLGANQEGELIIKGPQVMMGYLDELKKTKECLSSTGWLRTGDQAYYNEDGHFFITDRIKELIKTRGFQVAPAELEELLLGNEYVNDVAVIQIPDEESGELPRAYIVLKDGSADQEKHQEIKENIYEWVKERVAHYKRLDGGIIFVDSIPKSASGKILRRILRAEVAEQMKV